MDIIYIVLLLWWGHRSFSLAIFRVMLSRRWRKTTLPPALPALQVACPHLTFLHSSRYTSIFLESPNYFIVLHFIAYESRRRGPQKKRQEAQEWEASSAAGAPRIRKWHVRAPQQEQRTKRQHTMQHLHTRKRFKKKKKFQTLNKDFAVSFHKGHCWARPEEEEGTGWQVQEWRGGGEEKGGGPREGFRGQGARRQEEEAVQGRRVLQLGRWGGECVSHTGCSLSVSVWGLMVCMDKYCTYSTHECVYIHTVAYTHIHKRTWSIFSWNHNWQTLHLGATLVDQVAASTTAGLLFIPAASDCDVTER